MAQDYQNRMEYFDRGKFTQVENDVFNGLKLIGEEIATLFADGVVIKNDNLIKSKAPILGHIAREIDGGIRQVFAPKIIKKEIETSLDNLSLDQELKDHKGHISSIIAALGDNIEILKDDIAKKWIGIATKFVRLAHRSGPWKQTKSSSEVVEVWNDYVNILYKLFGNQLNILTRIDRILKVKEPHNDLINTIPNILKDNAIELYFFKNLTHLSWLSPLVSIKYFIPEKIYNGAHSIIDYLVRVAKENAKEEVTEELLKIVNECVDYRTTKIKDENPYIVDAAILEICVYLPINRIPLSVIQIIEFSIKVDPHFGFVLMSINDNFIPYLLKNKREDLFEEFLRIILAYNKKDRTYPDYESKINDSQLLEILRKSKKLIIEHYASVAISVVLKLIDEILKESPDEFNYWRISTIEDSSQITFYDRYQVQLVQLARDILLKINQDECEKIVIDWLHNEQSIYIRLAYYLLNKRYNEFSQYFWETKHNPLNDDLCMHELYELFREHSQEFSDVQINIILGWIETAEYHVSEDKGKEETEKKIAYNKREWLSALIDSENLGVHNKIKEYEKINSVPLSHPGHIIWHESGSGFKSPLDLSKHKDLSVEELVSDLSKIEYQSDSEALDNRGLNIQLADLVKENSSNVSSEIFKFSNLNISFQSDVINGLTNAWNEKKQIDWGNTLDFILSIIKQGSFWEKDYTRGYNFRNSFLRYVCELITAGTRGDENAFEEQYINKAEEILLLLDERMDEGESEFNDAATHYLNSTYGKFYDALLNLSIRYARVHKGSKKELWLSGIKAIFTRRLNRQEENTVDISVCLGGFLPYFIFLDHQWVKEDINSIFPKNNEPHWQAAMEGYLSFVRQYYEENYLLFRNNNHIIKAINSEYKGQIGANLFAHIMFAYLSDVEKLDDADSMICKIIESGKYYSAITRFLWIQRDNPNLNEATVFPLWVKIFNQLKADLQNEENQRTVSNLVQWLCFFNNISDELIEILKVSTKYLKRGFGTVHFVEELNRLRKIELKIVGDLFIDLLDAEDFPTYKAEHIQEIVEDLYLNNHIDIANNICIRYAKRNILFLRDNYEKYNT